MRLNCLAFLAVAGGTCGVAVASETATYSYDALGRLTGVSKSGGPRSGKSNGVDYDPAGNRLATGTGQAPPTSSNAAQFSISSPSQVTEGAAAVFTVTKSGTAISNLSVDFASLNGTAAAPADYTAASGTLTFRSWETARTVTIPTISDTATEPAEQFSVQLSSPSAGSTIGTATATATIAANVYNQPPVANADTTSVGVCESITINVVANDTDAEGNLPLSVTAIGTGTLGQASMVGSTSVKFRAFGATGADSISYTVSDSLGAKSSSSVEITIIAGQGCN